MDVSPMGHSSGKGQKSGWYRVTSDRPTWVHQFCQQLLRIPQLGHRWPLFRWWIFDFQPIEINLLVFRWPNRWTTILPTPPSLSHFDRLMAVACCLSPVTTVGDVRWFGWVTLLFSVRIIPESGLAVWPEKWGFLAKNAIQSLTYNILIVTWRAICQKVRQLMA